MPAFAQLFRPPVPAAQAQAYDNNANDAFNNEVSAQGGAPQAPPPADTPDSFDPAAPGVTAHFSQTPEGGDLPPPSQPPSDQPAPRPQMQPQNTGPAEYQGPINAQNLNPAANASS